MCAAKTLARNFAAGQSIEQFYSGGSIQIVGGSLLTPCNATLRVIDSASGRISGSIESDSDDLSITSIVADSDNDVVVIATSDLLLRQYSLSSKQLLKKWKSFHTAPIQYLCFVGGLIVSGSADRCCKVWDVQQSYCTHTLKLQTDATLSAMSLLIVDEKPTLICGLSDGSVLVWDLSLKGKEGLIARLDNVHSSAVTEVLVCNGKLVTSSKDQTVSVLEHPWVDRKATVIPVFNVINCMQPCITHLHVDAIKDLAQSNLDELFWCGSEEGALLLLDIGLRKVLLKLNLGNSSPVVQICASWETKSYWIATSDLILRCLHAESGKIVRQLVGCNEVINDLALVGSEENMLVVTTNTAHVRLYNTDNQACALLQGHASGTCIVGVDVAQWNRNIFATCAKDNTFRLWVASCAEGQTPKACCIALATGHTNSVTAVKISRLKSKFIVSVSNDRTLKLWGLSKRLHKQEYECDIEVETLTSLSTAVATEKDLTSVDIAPNDMLIATASMDKHVALWKITASQQLEAAGRMNHPRGVWDVRFSPADQVLATACGDGRLRIFALSDLSCVKTFECHDCAALKLRFLPSALQLVSTDGGGVIKLWDIKNSECVKSLEAHADEKVWALTVSNDGSKIISGGEDCRVVFWNDVTQVEQLQAEQKMAQDIKHEQSLSNLVIHRKYAEALRLAIHLSRPFNALNMVRELVHGSSKDQENELEKAIDDMKQHEIVTLLEYVVQWNTNTRNAYLAQRVLRVILMRYGPQELLKLPNVQHAVEGLLPYTERHFERLSRLEQQAAFVNYTWMTMRLTGQEH